MQHRFSRERRRGSLTVPVGVVEGERPQHRVEDFVVGESADLVVPVAAAAKEACYEDQIAAVVARGCRWAKEPNVNRGRGAAAETVCQWHGPGGHLPRREVGIVWGHLSGLKRGHRNVTLLS